MPPVQSCIVGAQAVGSRDGLVHAVVARESTDYGVRAQLTEGEPERGHGRVAVVLVETVAVEDGEDVFEVEVVAVLVAELEAQTRALVEQAGDDAVDPVVVVEDPALAGWPGSLVATSLAQLAGAGADVGGTASADPPVEVVVAGEHRGSAGARDGLGVTLEVVDRVLRGDPVERDPLLTGLVGRMRVEQGLEAVEVLVGALARREAQECPELAERVAVLPGTAQQVALPPALVPPHPRGEDQFVEGVLGGDVAGHPSVVAAQVGQHVASGVVALRPGL